MLVVQTRRHREGYTSESYLGSYETPIFLMYIDLGYIWGNIFHSLPTAHTILHGICKDVLGMMLSSECLKKYDGSYKDQI